MWEQWSAKKGVVEPNILRDAASARSYARKVLKAANGNDGKSMMDRAIVLSFTSGNALRKTVPSNPSGLGGGS